MPVAAAAALLLLAGCTNGATISGSGGIPAPDRAAEPFLPDEGAADGGTADGAISGRDVITTGQLDIVVDDPIDVFDDASDIVTESGGRIDASSTQPATDYQSASASITARIPADELEATIDAVSALGEVRALSTQASDVTAQTTDLDARIESLTASVARLRDLLATATNTADLIATETALSQREAELESLTAQREYLSDQVDYSTLQITLASPQPASQGAPTDFWGAVVAGFQALLVSLGAIGIAIGAALPWIVFLAVVAAIVVLIVRFARRRRSRRSSAR
ncbi:hypothetical protein L3i23_24370 [Herbiconiux sp. L3-i23]|nr:hypothetical protein L3i23_24370 [Herbiconiux sp. L3-i23]